MVNIKLSYLKILIVLSVLFILTLLNMTIFEINNIYIISSAFFIFIIIIKLLVGYESDRSRFKKDSLMNIFIYVMVYHIITYVCGIFIGFVRTIYSLEFLSIIKNVAPVIISIIVVEILRYVINKKIDNNKWLLLFSTIVFVLIDIMILVSLYSYQGREMWLTVIALAILPSISKNILLNYMAIKFGFYPGILYRLLMEIPIFLLPIFPNFNDYMQAIFGFVIPLVILFLMYRDIIKKTNKFKNKKENDTSLNKHYFTKIISLILIFVTILLIVLTSGIFTHFTLSIGSGSMEPNINMGDVVVVRKIDDPSLLEVDDVLVYEKDNIVIVHRINEVIVNNDKYSFITKGDNNNDVDNWFVESDTILGIVDLRIPIIGYPTIWINDLIK